MECSKLDCTNEAVIAISVHNAPNYALCDSCSVGYGSSEVKPLNKRNPAVGLSQTIAYRCNVCQRKIDLDNAFETYRPWRVILCGTCI